MLTIFCYRTNCCCYSVTQSWTERGLQQARLPSPSLSPGVCSNSCPLNRQYHPTISSPAALFLPSVFPSMRVFSSELALLIRWPKYWSFSISPSNEYSELISFLIDWLDLLAAQRSLNSLLQHCINSLVLSLLYGPALTSINDYWKKP